MWIGRLNRLSGLSEAGRGIILWFQHQPCGEVDIIFHPSKLRAFKCNVNYQNQSNCCRDINSTNVCQAEGRVWYQDNHVLRPLLTLHRVGRRRPCIINWPVWTQRGHVFVFHEFHRCLQYTMHCLQREFCRPCQLYLRNWWHVGKRIKWRNSVT